MTAGGPRRAGRRAPSSSHAGPTKPTCRKADGLLKTCYRLKAKAEQQIIRERSKGKRGKLWVYQCPLCGQWHLTSGPPRTKR